VTEYRKEAQLERQIEQVNKEREKQEFINAEKKMKNLKQKELETKKFLDMQINAK